MANENLSPSPFNERKRSPNKPLIIKHGNRIVGLDFPDVVDPASNGVAAVIIVEAEQRRIAMSDDPSIPLDHTVSVSTLFSSEKIPFLGTYYGTTEGALAHGRKRYEKGVAKKEEIRQKVQLYEKHNAALREKGVVHTVAKIFNQDQPEEQQIVVDENTVCFVSLREPASGEISKYFDYDSNDDPPVPGYEEFDDTYDEHGGIPKVKLESLVISIGFQNGEETRFVDVGDLLDVTHRADPVSYPAAIDSEAFADVATLAQELLDHPKLTRKDGITKAPTHKNDTVKEEVVEEKQPPPNTIVFGIEQKREPAPPQQPSILFVDSYGEREGPESPDTAIDPDEPGDELERNM